MLQMSSNHLVSKIEDTFFISATFMVGQTGAHKQRTSQKNYTENYTALWQM